MSRCQRFDDNALHHATSLRHLRVLSAAGTSISSVGAQHLPLLKSLTSLNLSTCLNVSDAAVNYLSGMTSIVKLDLSACKITMDAFRDWRSASKLAELDVSQCGGTLLLAFVRLLPTSTVVTASGHWRGVHLSPQEWRRISSVRGMEALELIDCPNLTSAHLSEAFRAASPTPLSQSLNQIALSGVAHAVEDGVAVAVASSPNLSLMDATNCYAVTDQALQHFRPTVKVTTASGKWKLRMEITDTGFKCVVARISGLTFLDLSGCSQISDVGIEALSSLATLREVDITGCLLITAVGVGKLPPGVTAVCKSSWCATKASDDTLLALSRLRGVTSLDLADSSGITDSGLHGFVSPASAASTIRTLNLTNCSALTNAAMKSVAQNMPALKALTISGCSNVTAKGLSHVPPNVQLTFAGTWRCQADEQDDDLRHVARLQNATAISLARSTYVTSAGIRQLVALPSFLVLSVTRIDMSYCPLISDEGLEALATLLNLATLNVSCCPQLTDVGLRHLSNKRSLKEIHVTGCYNFSDKGLYNVASSIKLIAQGHWDGGLGSAFEGCKGIVRLRDGGGAAAGDNSGLTSLTMARCRSELTNAHLAQVATMTRLTAVDLRGCTQITEEGVIYLVKNLTSLRTLDITDCKTVDYIKVKAAAVARAGSPQLQLVPDVAPPVRVHDLPQVTAA